MKGSLYPCDQCNQLLNDCPKRCRIFVARRNPFNPEFNKKFHVWTDFWERIEQEWAENEKKQGCYVPDTCPDMNEPGCTFPDCDNCEVVDDEEAEDW